EEKPGPAPRRKTVPPRKTVREPVKEGPREQSWGAPPPVRRGSVDEPSPQAAAPIRDEDITPMPLEVVSEPPDATHHRHEAELYPDLPAPRPRGRWGLWVVGALLLVVVGALGVGVVMVSIAKRGNEEKMAQEADDDYRKGQFNSASQAFDKLIEKYPDSDQ